MWCVIKVGGGGGGISTSLDVNGLKRVVGEFKVAGSAKEWASGFYRLLCLSCGLVGRLEK